MKMRLPALFCGILSIKRRDYESCSVCSFNPQLLTTNGHSPFFFFGKKNAGLARSLSQSSIHRRLMNSFNRFSLPPPADLEADILDADILWGWAPI